MSARPLAFEALRERLIWVAQRTTCQR